MPTNPHSGELLAESPVAVAEVMLTRALDAIEGCVTSDPIVDSYVVVGDIVFDECCGVLVGTAIRSFPTRNFPQPAVDVSKCDDTLLAVDIAVVLLRCNPVVDAQGNAPTSAEMSSTAAAVGNDAALILNAMMAAMPPGWERANLEQTFDGEGGCIAIDTRMTIGLPQSEWCVDCGAP